jgi:HlyD family secretion protein
MNASITTPPTTMNRSSTGPLAGTPAVPAPRRRSRLPWIVALVVLLAVGAGAGVYFKRKSAEKEYVVTTDKAVVKTITQVVNATGKIQPEVEVKISPEVAGEIIELPVREGSVVKKGRPDRAHQARHLSVTRSSSRKRISCGEGRRRAQPRPAPEEPGGFQAHRGAIFKQKLVSDSDFTAGQDCGGGGQANYDSSPRADPPHRGHCSSQARDQLGEDHGRIRRWTAPSALYQRGGRAGRRHRLSLPAPKSCAWPTSTNMEVRVNVNENDVVNVKVGDKARIAIDAYPNRKIQRRGQGDRLLRPKTPA